MTRHIAIVGGGIAGLACAHALAETKRFSVTVLEAQKRVGGKILSDPVGDLIFEGGPDSFITTKPWALALVQRLGLEKDLLPTHPSKKDVYVFTRGCLRRLPEGLMLMAPTKVLPFLSSDLVPWLTKFRMGLEMFIPRGGGGDESMGDFSRRRFGAEALETIVGPILAGIFAGDPDQLSMKCTFPQFVDLEKRSRSLILGMRRAKRPPPQKGRTMFMTMRGGLSRFAEELASRLPEGSIQTGAPVESIEKVGAHAYRARLSDGKEVAADGIVVCAPANHAARMLGGLDKDLASDVGRIPFSSTATVSLAYAAKDFPHPLDGFGFVVDRREKRSVMAATYSSTKFPGRVPSDKVLIRCFLGGAGQEDVIVGDDDALIRAVRADLKDIMGLEQTPVEARAYRWTKANPQYNVGHADLVERIESHLKNHPGIVLAGASYKGVGIPDCVRSGEAAAKIFSESHADTPNGAVC